MRLSDWWEGLVVGVAVTVCLWTVWSHRPTEREWRRMTRSRRDCARNVPRPSSHVRVLDDQEG